MKTDKSKWWFTWFVICVLSIISGGALAIASQTGDRFHTTVLEQIQAGDPPTLFFIRWALILGPFVITFILVRFYGRKTD